LEGRPLEEGSLRLRQEERPASLGLRSVTLWRDLRLEASGSALAETLRTPRGQETGSGGTRSSYRQRIPEVCRLTSLPVNDIV
jgi:hypothetical protein